MPYIPDKDRTKFDPFLKDLKPEAVGELNYAITCACRDYLYRRGESYETHDLIIGALECVKLEFYRRRTALYEDKKIQINGDV